MLATIATIAIIGCGPAPGSDSGGPPDAAADAGTDAGPDYNDLSSVLEPIRAASDLPGLAAAVIEGDALVALGAAGVRRYGDTTAVTLSDRWHLGSDTKAMTATLTATFVVAGTVAWETTLGEVFPDLVATMDPAYVDVTLEELLGHRGAMPATVPSAIWNPLFTDPRPVMEIRRSFVEDMLALPPEVAVGTYNYSNTGYIIAGTALEEITGIAWEQLMQDGIFQPLGMTSCGFGPPASPGIVDQPWGHLVPAGVPEPVDPGTLGADNPAALGPAGTVHCSLESWGRFASMHLLGAQGDASFLPSAQLTRMHTAWPGGFYALGWGVVGTEAWTAGDALTHAGSNTMFYAVVWIAPAVNLALLMATNRGDDVAPMALDMVVDALVGLYAN